MHQVLAEGKAFDKMVIDVGGSAKKSSKAITCTVQEFGVQTGASSNKSRFPGLNVEVKEFVPRKIRIAQSFCGVGGGTVAAANRGSTGVEKEVEYPLKLNENAKEFVPSKQVYTLNQYESSSSGRVNDVAAAVSTGKDTEITKSKPRCLNIFAKEFIPSNFHHNEAAQPRCPPQRYSAPAMTPV